MKLSKIKAMLLMLLTLGTAGMAVDNTSFTENGQEFTYTKLRDAICIYSDCISPVGTSEFDIIKY